MLNGGEMLTSLVIHYTRRQVEIASNCRLAPTWMRIDFSFGNWISNYSKIWHFLRVSISGIPANIRKNFEEQICHQTRSVNFKLAKSWNANRQKPDADARCRWNIVFTPKNKIHDSYWKANNYKSTKLFRQKGARNSEDIWREWKETALIAWWTISRLIQSWKIRNVKICKIQRCQTLQWCRIWSGLPSFLSANDSNFLCVG